MWVTRSLQSTGRALRTAYVEAVATYPGHRRRGFASALLTRLVEEVGDYDLAALSPSGQHRGPDAERSHAFSRPPPRAETYLVGVESHPRSGLTRHQLAALHDELVRLQREILARGQQRRPMSGGDPVAEGTPIGDAADQAEATFEQSILASLTESDRLRLRDVNDALERMEDGTYGLCQATDEPIGFDRLRAEPWARYTAEYQEKLEVALGTSHPPTL
jgi:RNA polymerase-binding transcription factor